MENILMIVIYIFLFSIRLSNGKESDKFDFTPIRVIDVKNGINNSYFDAVEDDTSPTGWAVHVKRNLTRYENDGKLIVFMYDNSPKAINASDEFHFFFSTYLCSLLIPDARYDQFPEQNNMPRDIIKLIFPGRQGNCALTEDTKPILSSAKVNRAEYNNPMVNFPNTSYFELYVNILSQKERSDKRNKYFFQVKLAVGNPSGKGSARVCLDTQWNYYIVWRICTIAEFFESHVSGIGRKTLRLLRF